jgi:hypothetical protein
MSKTNTDRNYYSATRDQRTNTWRGWVQFAGDRFGTTKTPQSFPTRRDAVAAIKAQHPDKIDSF